MVQACHQQANVFACFGYRAHLALTWQTMGNSSAPVVVLTPNMASPAQVLLTPYQCCCRWIRTMEGRRLGLKTFKPNNPTLMRGLETCIRLGSTALVEDLGEEVDPALQTILQNQIVQQVRAHVCMGAVVLGSRYCQHAACSRAQFVTTGNHP